MPQDRFPSTDSVTSPARECFAVVPSDTEELPQIPKALYVGTGGDLVLNGASGGPDVVFRNVPNGMILDLRPSFVRSTGTTAADIVGLA